MQQISLHYKCQTLGAGSNNKVDRCESMESLQGTYNVSADKVALPYFTPTEHTIQPYKCCCKVQAVRETSVNDYTGTVQKVMSNDM
jgi:hypothetical protein